MCFAALGKSGDRFFYETYMYKQCQREVFLKGIFTAEQQIEFTWSVENNFNFAEF